MKSCNSYQDIKTPEDEEYEEKVEVCFSELCDLYADEIAERGMKPHNRVSLMQRARKMASRRMKDDIGSMRDICHCIIKGCNPH